MVERVTDNDEVLSSILSTPTKFFNKKSPYSAVFLYLWISFAVSIYILWIYNKRETKEKSLNDRKTISREIGESYPGNYIRDLFAKSTSKTEISVTEGYFGYPDFCMCDKLSSCFSLSSDIGRSDSS